MRSIRPSSLVGPSGPGISRPGVPMPSATYSAPASSQVGRRVEPLGDHADVAGRAVDAQQPAREALEAAVARPLEQVRARRHRVEERVAELEHVDRSVRRDLEVGRHGQAAHHATSRSWCRGATRDDAAGARHRARRRVPPSSPSGDPENSVTSIVARQRVVAQVRRHRVLPVLERRDLEHALGPPPGASRTISSVVLADREPLPTLRVERHVVDVAVRRAPRRTLSPSIWKSVDGPPKNASATSTLPSPSPCRPCRTPRRGARCRGCSSTAACRAARAARRRRDSRRRRCDPRAAARGRSVHPRARRCRPPTRAAHASARAAACRADCAGRARPRCAEAARARALGITIARRREARRGASRGDGRGSCALWPATACMRTARWSTSTSRAAPVQNGCGDSSACASSVGPEVEAP